MKIDLYFNARPINAIGITYPQKLSIEHSELDGQFLLNKIYEKFEHVSDIRGSSDNDFKTFRLTLDGNIVGGKYK